MTSIAQRPSAAQNTPSAQQSGPAPSKPSTTEAARAGADVRASAYNPATGGSDPTPDDLDAALAESETGITFSPEDFANGQTFAQKTMGGLNVSATYDPVTRTINACGMDDKGSALSAQASGDSTAAVHFGITKEGQLLARTFSLGGQESRGAIGGQSGTGATAQIEGHGNNGTQEAQGDPMSAMTTLTAVVGDKRAAATAQAHGRQNLPSTPSSPTST